MLTHHAQVSNSTRQQNKTNQNHVYKSLYKEEEAQLYFARSFDFLMKSKKKKVFTLSMQGEESRYKEIFVRRIMIGDEFLTISVSQNLD